MAAIQQEDSQKIHEPDDDIRQAAAMSPSNLKRFTLVERLSDGNKDIPTKRLCEGVMFSNQRIAVHWIATGTITVWDSLEAMYKTLEQPKYGADLFWDDDPEEPQQ